MIKNYANKVMDYEYNAFMTLMNVSVSKHLFDEHFTVLWANDYFYQLIGYTKDEYEASFHNHVDEYFKKRSRRRRPYGGNHHKSVPAAGTWL